MRAGIAKSVFFRWQRGQHELTMRNYRRIRDAALGIDPVVVTAKARVAAPAPKSRKAKVPFPPPLAIVEASVIPPPRQRNRAA